jgi:uncharacterized membrane protein YkoI
MKSLILVPSLLAAGSLLVCASCRANHEEGRSGRKSEEELEFEENEEYEEHEAGESFALEKPATSLATAIATGQKSVPNGRFLQAEIESEGGKVICSTLFAASDGAHEINIDAANGQVLTKELEKLEVEATKLLEQIDKDPQHPPVSALQAIEAALAQAPGSWALLAKLGNEEGKLVYSVVLIDGQGVKLADVSAADGKVTQVRKAETEELEEGEEHEKP